MIRASFAKRAALGAAILASTLPAWPQAASAAIETDPVALYATMRKAFDTGTNHHWPFSDERYYLSTILDAGRAYSLFRPSDPTYAQLATLTVDVATQLHYDPLISDDAAAWYVSEAADYVVAHGDSSHVATASALLTKVQADDDPHRVAADAAADALANVQAFPADRDALASQIVAEIRAYNVTHDASYRSDMLRHAANPAAPLGRVPDIEFGEMFAIVSEAAGGATAYSDEDRANAKAIDERRKRTPELQVIGRVHATSHDLRMTHTAPADEYFGRLKMSPIGVRNELARINQWLDAGWGTHMTTAALNLSNSVIDWQRQYPHDLTLPQQLLNLYKTLARIDSDETHGEAKKIRDLLLVEYSNTSQAHQVGPS